MRRPPLTPPVLAPLAPLVALLFAACASAPDPAPTDAVGGAPGVAAAAPAVERPLSELASQRVVVVPVQRLRAGDSLGFAAAAGDPAAYLRALDDEITFALRERGLAGRWIMPGDAVRMARRNPTFGIDAHVLAAEEMRAGVRRGDPPDIPAALAQQLRTLVALGGEGTRLALVPGELRFAGAPGAARAVLHVVLVDTRRAQVAWEGDVFSDAAERFSPALLASVAGNLANLISAP